MARDDLFSSPVSAPESASPRAVKSDAAFRTISEVAEDLDVPQHVLRFWETKFAQIRPLKRGGGRRYYRPEDIALLRRIRALLYTDGMTIRGVQKLLRETGAKASAAGEAQPAPQSAVAPVQERGPDLREDLRGLLGELASMRDTLRAALR